MLMSCGMGFWFGETNIPADIQKRKERDRQDACATAKPCGFVASSEFQGADVFHVDRLPGAIQGDDDGEADRDFSGGDGDNEEDKNLGVVVGQSGSEMESGKGNERKVGGVQHQFERHENDDDVAPEENAGEPNGEKHPADNQIMAKCYHVMKRTKHECRVSKE
jgi:hypothetical protein